MAIQESVFTRVGCERVLRYAFWDQIADEVAAEYPDVRMRILHADALAARLVLHPNDFDVIVGSTLFGDVLSDLTIALSGGLGVAASASINPEASVPGLFEPVHGSAPDIAGRGLTNPIAQTWAGALMFDQLGEPDAAAAVVRAVVSVTRTRKTTPDLGGSLTTAQAGAAIGAAVEATASEGQRPV